MHSIDPMLCLYLPATHPLQLPSIPVHPLLHIQAMMLSLANTEYELAGHKRHFDLSPAEYEPAAHSLHVSVDSLSEPEYFPAVHGVHATDPVLSLYFPATHPLQLPSIPVHPLLQIQAVMFSLANTEYELAGHNTHFVLSSVVYESAVQVKQIGADAPEYFPDVHRVQATEPLLSLYLPATHPLQSPSFPVHPMLHLQNVMS